MLVYTSLETKETVLPTRNYLSQYHNIHIYNITNTSQVDEKNEDKKYLKKGNLREGNECVWAWSPR